jgi:hypothetical protein
MNVHLIKKQSIEDYVLRNARSRVSFEIWLSIIKWVGTHAEYTKHCNDGKQFEIDAY